MLIIVGECRSDNANYNGNVNIAANGRPCRRWEIYAETYGYTLDQFPDASWEEAGNYCRFVGQATKNKDNPIVCNYSNIDVESNSVCIASSTGSKT